MKSGLHIHKAKQVKHRMQGFMYKVKQKHEDQNKTIKLKWALMLILFISILYFLKQSYAEYRPSRTVGINDTGFQGENPWLKLNLQAGEALDIYSHKEANQCSPVLKNKIQSLRAGASSLSLTYVETLKHSLKTEKIKQSLFQFKTLMGDIYRISNQTAGDNIDTEQLKIRLPQRLAPMVTYLLSYTTVGTNGKADRSYLNPHDQEARPRFIAQKWDEKVFSLLNGAYSQWNQDPYSLYPMINGSSVPIYGLDMTNTQSCMRAFMQAYDHRLMGTLAALLYSQQCKNCTHQEAIPIACPSNNQYTLIAANLHQSEQLLPQYMVSMMGAASVLAPCGVHVSIYESGSRDSTPTLLRCMTYLAQTVSIKATIVSNSTDIRHKINGTSMLEERIEFLARMRNAAMQPLYDTIPLLGSEAPQQHGQMVNMVEQNKLIKYATVLFVNDVFFCPYELLRLQARSFYFDFVCGLDFSPIDADDRQKGVILYDKWVARDITGRVSSNYYPYFNAGGIQFVLGQLTPVGCCWNGMVALNAKPFYEGVKFRAYLEGECRQSECTNLCVDYITRGYNKFVMDPGVQVAYDWVDTYYMQAGKQPVPAILPFEETEENVRVLRSTGPWIGQTLDCCNLIHCVNDNYTVQELDLAALETCYPVNIFDELKASKQHEMHRVAETHILQKVTDPEHMGLSFCRPRKKKTVRIRHFSPANVQVIY